MVRGDLGDHVVLADLDEPGGRAGQAVLVVGGVVVVGGNAPARALEHHAEGIDASGRFVKVDDLEGDRVVRIDEFRKESLAAVRERFRRGVVRSREEGGGGHHGRRGDEGQGLACFIHGQLLNRRAAAAASFSRRLRRRKMNTPRRKTGTGGSRAARFLMVF